MRCSLAPLASSAPRAPMAGRWRRPITAAASFPRCLSTPTAMSSSPIASLRARSWRPNACPTGSIDVDQLPIFLNLAGRTVVLVGKGEAADAKARLIVRAGGRIVPEWEEGAAIAFVAPDDEADARAAATALRARGLLVNVVDRPDLCDFTTPAIVDRAPVTIAIGTGGASAGLAKPLPPR